MAKSSPVAIALDQKPKPPNPEKEGVAEHNFGCPFHWTPSKVMHHLKAKEKAKLAQIRGLTQTINENEGSSDG